MASSYTARYLQMKLKDPQRQFQKNARGIGHERSPLGMAAPALRSTATVTPLTPVTPSSSRLSSLSQRGVSSHISSSATGRHSESFAAALRKLARQSGDPQESLYGVDEHSSPALQPCSPGRAPVDTQRVGKPMPVVSIPPTRLGGDLWRNDSSRPFLIHHSRNELPLSAAYLLKHERTTGSSLPAHYFHRSSAQETGPPSLSLQRAAGKRSDGYPAGFHPYISRDAVRPLPTYPSLPVHSAASSYYYPAFLPHFPLHPTLCMFEDPYYLSAQTPLLHSSEMNTFSTFPTSGLQLPSMSSDTASVRATVLRNAQHRSHTDRRSREDMNSHRPRENHHESDSRSVTPRSGRSSETPLEKERKRLREPPEEKDFCREKELKQDKEMDKKSPEPRFNNHHSNRSPCTSFFRPHSQKLYQVQEQSPWHRTSLSSAPIDPKKSLQYERASRSSELENNTHLNSASTSSSSPARIYPISPLSSSWPGEKEGLFKCNLNLFKPQHTSKEEAPNHISPPEKEKLSMCMNLKAGDTSSDEKAREDQTLRTGLLSSNTSRIHLREAIPEPKDYSEVLDFSQRGSSAVKRDWHEPVQQHAKGSANSTSRQRTHSPELLTAKTSLTVAQRDHYKNSAGDSAAGLSSVPDLLTHIPRFPRAHHDSYRQDLTGKSSSPGVQDSQVLSLDLSMTTLDGATNLRVTSHCGQNEPGSGILGAPNHVVQHWRQLELKPLTSEMVPLERNVEQSRKRGLSFQNELSGREKKEKKSKKLYKLMGRYSKRLPVKTGASSKAEQVLVESSLQKPVSKCSGAEQESVQSTGGPDETLDFKEKKQFLALLDLKPQAASQGVGDDGYSSPGSRSQGPTDEEVIDSNPSNLSEEEELKDSCSEGEAVWMPKWQGIDGVFETYTEYMEERELEESVLQEQLISLKEENTELNLTVENLSSHLQELESNKQKLEKEQKCHQAAIDCLKKCLTFTV
ncbi:genetic suppressor element 1 isoform X1 [Amia ocellicauda]|uniref:genetic suppressor element 1 isoform X1 n=1 Tax=Amia ocellicauda TaxID=2972642 RepID=UPI003464237B